jgi:hypothetical protein
MRTNSAVWAATLALLSSPLSIIVEAAPAPYPRHGHQRRYLVPVRRQNSGGSNVNLSGGDPGSISSSSITSSITSDAPSISIPLPSDTPQGVDPDMPPFISSQTLFVVSTTATSSIATGDPNLDPSPSSTDSPSASTTDSSSGSAVPAVVVSASSSDTAAAASSTDVSSQVVLDPSSAPTSSVVVQPLIVGLNTILTSPTVTASSSPSSTSDPNIIGSLMGQLSSIIQSNFPTAGSTGSAANAMNPDPSISSSAATSTAGVLPIIPIISSALGTDGILASLSIPTDPTPTVSSVSVDPPVSIPISVAPSDPIPSSAAGTGLPILPIVSSIVSQVTDQLPPPVSSVIPPPSAPTGSAVDSIPAIISTILPSVSLPINPGDPVSVPAVTASIIPSGVVSAPADPINSGVPSGVPISSASAPVVPKPAASVIPVDPSSAPIVIPSALASQNIVQPTATDSQTALSLPSNILVNSAPAASATLSPNAPKVLQPPGGTPTKQADETLVQIGFNKSLNYAFVSSNSASAGQIFTFLPQGVSDGLGITVSQIRIQSIQPYDTLKQMGFVTALALLYVPTTLVDKLTILLHTPSSGIYLGHELDQINAFMPFINPAIPLLAGQTMGDSGGSNGVSMLTTSPGSQAGGSPFGPDSANTEPVRTTSAAIAGPVTFAGAAYAVAMVFVARRYRARRRQRQSELSNQNSPVWMSGGRSGSGSSRESRGSGNSNGRSIRSQEISAPVMAQNSLGWN